MTEKSAASSTARRQTGRSPSFPAINLETAIRRARELYERERQHPTAVETIVQYWGYKSMSGPANATLAAVKKFGLMTDEGKGTERRGRLTHLAVDIIANPDAAARVGAIKQAALTPAMHREMWDKFHNSPPSDANLQWELVRQRGFTESGAEEFIREYKQTVTFAQLDASDHTSASTPEDLDEAEAAIEADQPPPRQQTKISHPAEGTAQYRVPVFHGKSVLIEGEFPLSEEDWDQFMAVLTAMRPALVSRSLKVSQGDL